jgi:electron transfer flavoprotein alpha subunit
MANRVWIVVQPRGGVVPRQAWEAVAAGQRLAAALGGPAEKAEKAAAVVVGSGVAEAAAAVGRCDLAAVHVAEHARLATYTPGVTIGALAPALRAARPDFVVFPHTYQTVDFLARLAEATGAGLLPEVTGFSSGDSGGLLWTRPILGGKMEAKVRVQGEGTVLVSVQSGAFAADSRVAGAAPPAPPTPIMPLALDEAALVADREVLGYEEVGGDTVDLTKADIIVAVGRGVGGADKMGPVEELAKALGADIGASRPVIDNGWLPRDRQIGSSGATVAPKLYIAAGISGAIQHLVGMKGSSVIVAINKDPGAPIFAVADYGIVGDLHEVLPALTEAIRAARG